jgi:hypothetical protein
MVGEPLLLLSIPYLIIHVTGISIDGVVKLLTVTIQ